jgi:hypothetical protein
VWRINFSQSLRSYSRHVTSRRFLMTKHCLARFSRVVSSSNSSTKTSLTHSGNRFTHSSPACRLSITHPYMVSPSGVPFLVFWLCRKASRPFESVRRRQFQDWQTLQALDSPRCPLEAMRGGSFDPDQKPLCRYKSRHGVESCAVPTACLLD